MVIHPIGDDCPFNSEKSENMKVLFRLGHPPVISSNHKKSHIHSAHASDHVVDKIGMTGNVDDSDLQELAFFCGIWQREVGESKFNCHTPALLFRQTIRIRASKSPHKGGLPMIDMARCPKNKVLFSTHRDV